MLHRLVEWIKPFAASLGGPGLFLVAFLDSSFLSFPEVPDLLLVWLVTRHPERWPYYASMTTAGSVLGCFALYYVARKGGERVVRRFSKGATERALNAIRRYGVLAVIVPAILPPPAPFKVFVVLAGASAIPAASFGIALVIGRSFRYVAEALFAYYYGARAMAYINENMARLSLWVALAVAGAGAAYIIWRTGRRQKA